MRHLFADMRERPADFAARARRHDEPLHRPDRRDRRRGGAAISVGNAVAQARLAVGPAVDPFEREADESADRVVRSLAGSRSGEASPTTSSGSRVQRAPTIGAKGGAVDGVTERQIRSRRGNGTALPGDARRKMEGAFGTDFGAVRVHEGPAAAELCDRIQAKAFTVGNDVFFRDGVPDARSRAGQHLLAHELTHTIQQGGVSAANGAVAARSPETIQRLMPTKRMVESAIGPAADDKRTIFGGVKEKSKLYKPILARLDAVDKWARRTKFAEGDPAKVEQQLATYNFFLDDVEQAITAFIARKRTVRRKPASLKGKLAYLDGLLHQLGRERVVAAEASRSQSRAHIQMGATWMGVLMGAGRGDVLAAPAAVDLTASDPNATFGGGVNQVEQHTKHGITGGFKKGVESVRLEDELDADGDRPGATEAEMNLAFAFADFEMDVAAPAMPERDVAMSRLDQLLGGGVVARAELAKKGEDSGSLMDWSDAVKPGALKDRDDSDELAVDPNLQRLMSRLHMIDILAMQADRHAGNFLLEVEGGRVAGIVGIDNDMSFGKRTSITKERQEFRKLQKYVDKDLAERILRLRMDDVRWALSSLLSAGELAALATRLEALQAQLLKVKGDGGFLAPAEWTREVAQGMLAENNGGYYAKAAGRIKGT